MVERSESAQRNVGLLRIRSHAQKYNSKSNDNRMAGKSGDPDTRACLPKVGNGFGTKGMRKLKNFKRGERI